MIPREAQQCQETNFEPADTTFRPRRGNKLDDNIAKILHYNNIDIPVANIRDGLYLIGPNRCNCELKYSSVMVKVGGGWMKLEEYLRKNERSMQH